MSDKSQKNKRSKDSLFFARSLLRWYDRNHRHLPWRAESGMVPDPYYVWLSEIMLQQTMVATVVPYFYKFIKRWPQLEDLANAKHDDVLRMWAGLGYYRRAHLLHDCAQVVAVDYGGVFPSNEEILLGLPGIGPYTSAAIAAIAFNKKANVVDGNVERIMARIFAVKEPLPAAKVILKEYAAILLPTRRYGDYAQGLMDLGATVCSPRSPKCDLCPWLDACKAYDEGRMEDYPVRPAKKAKPLRKGTAFVLLDQKGNVLLRKRSEKGLLAGMMEVPSSQWTEKHSFSFDEAPVSADWHWCKGRIHHVFTHFDLEMRVAVASILGSRKMSGTWVSPSIVAKEALPSVMRKILQQAKIGDL